MDTRYPLSLDIMPAKKKKGKMNKGTLLRFEHIKSLLSISH